MPNDNRKTIVKSIRLREALIAGVFTVLAASVSALLSNWDELFSQTISVTYDRQPTDDFGTETRYYLDISGIRESLEVTLDKSLDGSLKQMECSYLHFSQSDPLLWQEVYDAIHGERITADQIIASMVPVYEKHFSLSEMQELNRLYSSGLLRAVSGRTTALTEDLLLTISKLRQDGLTSYARRIGSEFKNRPDIVQIAESLKRSAKSAPYYAKGLCPPRANP